MLCAACSGVEAKELKKTACGRHPDRCLVLYCRDCSQATCELCFIHAHNGHLYAGIEDVAELLDAQLAEVLERVQSRTSSVSQQQEAVDEYRSKFNANVHVCSSGAHYTDGPNPPDSLLFSVNVDADVDVSIYIAHPQADPFL